jgi:hypothetical protein
MPNSRRHDPRSTNEAAVPSSRTRLSAAKETLAVVREIVLVAIVLLLLLWPSFINDRLIEAGFVRGDFWGFEWEATVAESTRQTNDALQQVTEVQENLSTLQADIEALEAKVQSPDVIREVRRIGAQLDDSVAATRSADQELTRSRDSQEALLRAARVRPTARPIVREEQTAVIVISADTTRAQAEHERKRAAEAGYERTFVYVRGKWFRTAIDFPTRAAATRGLPEVRRTLNSGAYVVELDDWCPGRDLDRATGLYRCTET